jgi:hypothetical protein
VSGAVVNVRVRRRCVAARANGGAGADWAMVGVGPALTAAAALLAATVTVASPDTTSAMVPCTAVACRVAASLIRHGWIRQAHCFLLRIR